VIQNSGRNREGLRANNANVEFALKLVGLAQRINPAILARRNRVAQALSGAFLIVKHTLGGQERFVAETTLCSTRRQVFFVSSWCDILF